MVDSYAWVEVFLGSSKGNRVKSLIEAAEDAYTPDSVLAELSKKYFQEDVAEKQVRDRLASVQAASHVVIITSDLAIAASKPTWNSTRKHEKEGFDHQVFSTAWS